jgi:hypothetical protein
MPKLSLRVGRYAIVHGCDESIGRGRWRKRKGAALVRLPDGVVTTAEVHWYEASGIGRKEIKVKRLFWD